LQVSKPQLILVGGVSLIHFLSEKVEYKDTDTQLLEKVKNSDMEAFRLLFERYQPVIFRQVVFQIGQTDLSHDIVQETFIRVWEHRGSLQPHLSFLAYILRISRNLIYDHVKHKKVRERSEEILPPPNKSELDNPDEVLQVTMLQERIHAIINKDLPKRCREIFLLSRFEGKTHKEIADALDLSVKTIENQIHFALKVMRKNLKM